MMDLYYYSAEGRRRRRRVQQQQRQSCRILLCWCCCCYSIIIVIGIIISVIGSSYLPISSRWWWKFSSSTTTTLTLTTATSWFGDTTSSSSSSTTTTSTTTTATTTDDGEKDSFNDDDSGERRRHKRPIPEKVIIGYATHCDDQVKQAVRNGVNVVIWAFLGPIQRHERHRTLNTSNSRSTTTTTTTTGFYFESSSSLDYTCIKQMIYELDHDEGYTDTLHLISVGGWNGQHIDDIITSKEWYDTFQRTFGVIFHGIDWDLEGNTDLKHPNNYFSTSCLNKVGEISTFASNDGYVISIVPAQSYLDVVGGTSQFSLYVNHTEVYRPWHSDFHYFGRNVYAYLLAKYSNSIDLIIIQFYESYSRASMAINYYGISHESYLELYLQTLYQQQYQYYVDFQGERGDYSTSTTSSSLPTLNEYSLLPPSQMIHIPISKLVLGFANVGSASDNYEKNVYFDPIKIKIAYERLQNVSTTTEFQPDSPGDNDDFDADRDVKTNSSSLTPRGFMFWVIGREGADGVHYYAKGLNDILHIRRPTW